MVEWGRPIGEADGDEAESYDECGAEEDSFVFGFDDRKFVERIEFVAHVCPLLVKI